MKSIVAYLKEVTCVLVHWNCMSILKQSVHSILYLGPSREYLCDLPQWVLHQLCQSFSRNIVPNCEWRVTMSSMSWHWKRVKFICGLVGSQCVVVCVWCVLCVFGSVLWCVFDMRAAVVGQANFFFVRAWHVVRHLLNKHISWKQ